MATSASTAAAAALDDHSPAVASAWAESPMAAFPPRIADRLLASSRQTTVRAGETFYRGSEHSEMVTLALVVEGLLRIFIRANDGRQVTIHYAPPGALVGLPALLLAGVPTTGQGPLQQWLMLGGASLYGEALQDSILLRFSPAQFRRLAESEATVAWPLLSYLARRTAESQQMLAADVFLPVRARVARHVMDLAVRSDGRFVVTVSHQEIADAIGSVREVVSRTLLRLQKEGVLQRSDGRNVIVDPARLHEISTGA